MPKYIKNNFILASNEPHPVHVLNHNAKSKFILTADHAGNIFPHTLKYLGLHESKLSEHICWDLGIAGLTEKLSGLLDATAIMQRYSRLVIDCNRRPDTIEAFVEISDMTIIPGNINLSKKDREARRVTFFDPYHSAIQDQIIRRQNVGQLPIYVALHSFTPMYKGIYRPMHVGILYNHISDYSKRVSALLRIDKNLIVVDNKPYQINEKTDYGIPVHAESRGLACILIEIRNDLLLSEIQQSQWAKRLALALTAAAS